MCNLSFSSVFFLTTQNVFFPIVVLSFFLMGENCFTTFVILFYRGSFICLHSMCVQFFFFFAYVVPLVSVQAKNEAIRLGVTWAQNLFVLWA